MICESPVRVGDRRSPSGLRGFGGVFNRYGGKEGGLGILTEELQAYYTYGRTMDDALNKGVYISKLRLKKH